MAGRIVILNGVPRSGKSSIARAMGWLTLGVDALAAATPEAYRPGIGLRPGGERPDLEPFVLVSYRGLFTALARLAAEGTDVVSDVGIHDGYSQPRGILAMAREMLPDALFVGVRCPIETIQARRRADPQDGHYTVDEALARRWEQAVHSPGEYDLEVDTVAMSPDACGQAIIDGLRARSVRP